MSTEKPGNIENKEDWEALRNRAKKLWERVEKIQPERQHNHFTHVSWNLITGFASVVDPDEYLEPDPNKFNDYKKSVDYLEKYLNLIDNFPEFKNKEMAQEDFKNRTKGYFPDLDVAGERFYSSIDVMDNRLKNKNH